MDSLCVVGWGLRLICPMHAIVRSIALGSREFVGCVGGLGLFVCWVLCLVVCDKLGVLVHYYHVQTIWMDWPLGPTSIDEP